MTTIPNTCKNCHMWHGLHHYETQQCPVSQREDNNWRATTFEPCFAPSQEQLENLNAIISGLKKKETSRQHQAAKQQIQMLQEAAGRMERTHAFVATPIEENPTVDNWYQISIFDMPMGDAWYDSEDGWRHLHPAATHWYKKVEVFIPVKAEA